ncbi:hypothetical protein Vadar_015713 [Vaccinium darrowii]|uniref:Uncharacterized protein n=1 Tax=Vaccinium darrowii TaxID=229202 RepID=A0ACB7YW47_9ERIC|nr:hypothetical protein Vadar_015713 [Vaccinium darrowii]
MKTEYQTYWSRLMFLSLPSSTSERATKLEDVFTSFPISAIQNRNNSSALSISHLLTALGHYWVGISLPTVEVRFEHLTIEADCYIGDRALPTLANALRNTAEAVLGLVGIRLAETTKLTILKDASGIIKPSRFFKQLLVVFLIQQMAAGLFRVVAGVSRTYTVANTGGSLSVLLIFLLGGFILPRGEMTIRRMSSRSNANGLSRNEDSSLEAAHGLAPKRGMVLPFTPLAMSFDTVNYFVDMPPVPNILGFIFGVLQMVLYLIYKYCSRVPEEQQKLPSIVKLETIRGVDKVHSVKIKKEMIKISTKKTILL